MKKLILLTVMMIGFAISGFAKYYIGVTTTNVNLREGPSTYFGIVCKVAKGAYVFIDTDDSTYGFYRVVNVDNGEVGYISKKYVYLGQEVEVDENGSLQLVGETYSYDADIKITNRSSYTCTLKIGSEYFKFAPYETRTISVTPGTHNIVASAPGVIPYVGKDTVKGGYEYSWVFYTHKVRR